jgi:SAM-dependent methyltransferase
MLSYTRFPEAYAIVKYFNSVYRKTKRHSLNVLDYGCSIADYGLALACNGYNVTLCDIKDGNIEIGKQRFEKRHLKYSTITVSLHNLYPQFSNIDIVVAGEVFEHLRDPLTVVKNIYNGLNNNGYLWVSSYPVIEAELGEKHPDHLPEAAELRLDVLSFLNTNFTRCTIGKGYLFKKTSALNETNTEEIK